MAAGVTFSSSAARLKLKCRAADSNARSAFKGIRIMTQFDAQPRPSGAIPAFVIDDDELIRAQSNARREQSQAIFRALQWGVGKIQGLAR